MSGNVGIVSPTAIEPISWVEARQVHPDEARDFTPWLAQHLDLLVPVLALSDLELVRVEQSIAPFRLDIRAIGSDPAGQVGVVIENQYGRTDHDHLGKLITYAAQAAVDHERVLAVWIAESTAAPHEAAIEHLNRTTQQGMGYLLLRVRFAPSPNGYYVHFEKVVAPNEFISEVLHAQSPVNPERREFMAAVYAEVDPSVRSAGYRNTWLNPNGWVIRARMPTTLPLSAWCEPRLRMTSTDATVTLRFGRRGAGIAAARAALTAAQARHGAAFQTLVGEVDWDLSVPNQANNAFAQVVLRTGGYAAGTPQATAAWASEVMKHWLDATRQEPLAAGELPPLTGLEPDGDEGDDEIG